MRISLGPFLWSLVRLHSISLQTTQASRLQKTKTSFPQSRLRPLLWLYRLGGHSSPAELKARNISSLLLSLPGGHASKIETCHSRCCCLGIPVLCSCFFIQFLQLSILWAQLHSSDSFYNIYRVGQKQGYRGEYMKHGV